MTTQKEAITFHVMPTDKASLRKLAERKGFSMSTYCRFLLIEYLTKEAQNGK